MKAKLRSPLEEIALGGLQSVEGLHDVESLLSRLALGARLDRAGQMAQEHLQTGGKRIRARLALAAAEAMGVDRRDAVPWAAACELLHNAAIIHDDIQDGDAVRRGRPALWSRYGVGQAINAGDLMLMLAPLAVEHAPVDDSVKYKLCRALSSRAEETVRGQCADIDLLSSRRLDWVSYVRAAEGKTGALMALPVEGAALMAGLSENIAQDLSLAFARLGVMFQLQDDLLDLYGDKGRGERGCDIREGKVSALVVEHVRQHPRDAAWLVEILALPREQTSPQDVERVTMRFLQDGALNAVLQRIQAYYRVTETSPLLRSIPDLYAVAMELAELSLSMVNNLELLKLLRSTR